MGVVGILLVESMIIVDKIDGTEGAVGLYLTHHTAYAVAVVGVVLTVKRYTVIARGEQGAAFRDIETHPLVHNSNQVFGRVCTTRLGISIRHLILRE